MPPRPRTYGGAGFAGGHRGDTTGARRPRTDQSTHGDELGLLAVRAAAIAEQPTLGHREAAGVTHAQVVGVGIALPAEVVEPDLGLSVLVGQRDRRPLRAACP